MAKYVHSGKINLPKTLIAIVLAVAVSFVLGILYALVSNLTTIIFVDLILMLGVLALVAISAVGMVRLGAVRNIVVKILLGAITGFVSWYTAWTYLVRRDFAGDYAEIGKTFSKIANYLDTHSFSIGKMTSSSSITFEGAGMWTFAVIERLLFLAPIAVAVFVNNFYCERCNKFNAEDKFYTDAAPGDQVFTSAAASGNFNTVAELPRFAALPLRITSEDLGKTIYEVNISHCRSCGKNGVISVRKGNYKIDEKKKKTEFTGSYLFSDVLVDDLSIEKLAP